jgi:hypothetical protein
MNDSALVGNYLFFLEKLFCCNIQHDMQGSNLTFNRTPLTTSSVLAITIENT